MVCECGISGPHDSADHAAHMADLFRKGPTYQAWTEEQRNTWERTAAVVSEHLLSRLGRPSMRGRTSINGVETFYISTRRP